MQVDEEVGHAGMDAGMTCLHLCEPILHQLCGAVGEVLAETLQRRALRPEEQEVQQVAVPVDEADIFVDATAQVGFGLHQQDVLAVCPVVALQHGVEGGQHGAQQFAEQLVLAGEIMVKIAYGDACLGGHLAHGGLGIAVAGEELSGHIQNPVSYVSFQYLHRVFFYGAKVGGSEEAGNTQL